MDTKDLNGPAPGEQSGKKYFDTGNTEKDKDVIEEADQELKPDKTDKTDKTSDKIVDQDQGKKQEPPADAEHEKQSATEGNDDSETEPEPDTGQKSEAEPESETESGIETGPGPEVKPEQEAETTPKSESKPETESVAEHGSASKADPETENKPSEKNISEKPPQTEEEDSGEDSIDTKSIDLANLDKEGLLKVLEELINSDSVNNIRGDVEEIKGNFYKRHKAELEQKRKIFMQEGGNAEEFEPGEDPAESRFKELYKKYRHSKAAHNRSLEKTREENLEEKMKVVDDLKELVNRQEDINLTFREFRKLQKRWHEIGMVPQQNLKDLWNTYHHHVETFYDHIKINKELKDLDLKKNLEVKIRLCEKAEELLLEPDIINAFRKLQKHHDQWRETGPVPRDQKDIIWERFREVTHQINKKHQEHFDNLKETQKKNLETKVALCEKAEKINEISLENFQQAEKLTKEMINLQRTWKTIGFAPKKDNNKIFQRFRNACDNFFARKREFNAENRQFLNDNLQKKIDLCAQAEALKDSDDWKRTTDHLIMLQKRWKEIGPVPRKHYDPLWKRFRAACDHFFTKKSEFYSTIDNTYEENLKKKLEIIDKIENLKSSNQDDNLKILKEYQREWVSIGFVPIKEKENIQKRYRSALDKHFEGLKMDDQKKSLMKFKHKLEEVKENPNSYNKLKFDREKFLNRFKQLENDITLWENNIGFFAKSKTAEATIKEFRDKIENGKKQMAVLEEKIRLIDDLD